MSDGNENVPSPTVIIVRRGGHGEDEGHHGGAWKIAYADFMTAMMAFFLVMWLVNAADKKTIVQVAAYFNPIKLTDKTPKSSGIENQTEAEAKSSEKKKKTKGKEPPPTSEVKAEKEAKEAENEAHAANIDATVEKASGAASAEESKPDAKVASKTFGQAQKEAELFSDPIGILDKLAMKAGVGEGAGGKAASQGSMLRDPFDPSQRLPLPPAAKDAAKETAKDAAKEMSPPPKGAQGEGLQELTQDKEGAKPPSASAGSLDKSKTPGKAKAAAATAPQTAKTKEDPDQMEAEKLQKEIDAEFNTLGGKVPNVEVRSTPEGILLSISDDSKFGMFAVGSAEPIPDAVVAISKIGDIIKSRQGDIIVRGHTDGRPYAGTVYGNWRLSADRAQMAYHMIVRGGVDPARIVSIEGRADRELKIPDNKEAAQNRRIEVFIKTRKP